MQHPKCAAKPFKNSELGVNLADLAEEKINMQPIWGETAVRAVLQRGARRNEVAIKQQAMRALANIAADEANARPMWEDEGTRAALIFGARENRAFIVRDWALKAIALLIADDENKAPMWEDVEGTRAVLLAGASPTVDTGPRTHALFALTLFSHLPSLRSSLADAGVRKLLASGRDSTALGWKIRQVITDIIHHLGEEPPQEPVQECKQQ